MSAPSLRDTVAEYFDGFLHQEGARGRPYDFADGLLVELLPLVVESIAEVFDDRAALAAVADRSGRDIDARLAWESAAKAVREHAGKGFPLNPPAVSTPGGTSGARCPSRIAHESGAVHGCQLPANHAGPHGTLGAGAWGNDDDRLLPATSPTGEPTP